MLARKLREVSTYEAWQEVARKLEQAERREELVKAASSFLPWRRQRAQWLLQHPEEAIDGWSPDSRLQYDRELVEERLRLLVQSRASGDVGEMMFALRADLLRNLGNVTNIGKRLHEPEHQSVPRIVREYIEEVRMQLRLISSERDLRPEEKLAFLSETRHCFGRTALLLSGGGSLGAFHIGVVRSLVQTNLLPRVLAGSSVGSVVCSIIATRTQEELQQLFNDDASFAEFLPDMTFFSGRTLGASVLNYVRTGAMHDVTFFQKRLRAILGDITFQDAYDRSGGRMLCVAVCATREGERPRLLNYLTAPHLIVWSAVAASCAFPGLFAPQPLLAKSRCGSLVPWQPEGKMGARRWHDGSLEEDLPMKGLSELFNVNYFIVSQTNPHIVPILALKRWICKKNPTLAAIAVFIESEWKHRCRQVRDLWPAMDVFNIFSLFGQTWEGDVTVVMPFISKQLSKVVSNPSKEELLETALLGEREMWPKLAMIETNCGIEVQLDECTRELRQIMQQRATNISRRGRVPSWNTIGYQSGRDLSMTVPSGVRGSAAGGQFGYQGGGHGGSAASNTSSDGGLDKTAAAAENGPLRMASTESLPFVTDRGVPHPLPHQSVSGSSGGGGGSAAQGDEGVAGDYPFAPHVVGVGFGGAGASGLTGAGAGAGAGAGSGYTGVLRKLSTGSSTSAASGASSNGGPPGDRGQERDDDVAVAGAPAPAVPEPTDGGGLRTRVRAAAGGVANGD